MADKKTSTHLSVNSGALPSPGRLLADARERLKVTQQEVAVELNLGVDIIDALEKDQYDELPGPAFSRGYLRSYARLVGVDVNAIVNSDLYINMAQGTATSIAKRLNRGKMPTNSTAGSKIAVLFLIVVVFGVALWVVLKQKDLPLSGSVPTNEQSSQIILENSLITTD